MSSNDKNIIEILRKKGIILYRKLSRLHHLLFYAVMMLLHIPWAVPGVFLIRLLRPWKLIRLGGFTYSRIGHFVPDVGHQWIMRQSLPKTTIDLYWLPSVTCNDFWAKMVRRNFPVYAWVRPLDRWNQLLPGGAIHHRPSSITRSRDRQGLFTQNQARMSFLPEEDEKAKSWLRQQGWRDGDPYVCLQVRDSKYLETDPLHRQLVNPEGWNYHNYRDSDIATYVPAAEWLAHQGVWVIRMGKIMAKPIPTSHCRIIDYAFHPDKSDFLDVWLFANCSLCISTSSGPDWISAIHRIPLLFVNFLPLIHLWSWSNATHIPKLLRWRESRISLTWREHLNNSYFYSQSYSQADIEIVDLTAEEIRASVQECWQRIQGTWLDSKSDITRHHCFWHILKSHPDFSKYHDWLHPESRVATTWLRAVGDQFLQ